MFLYHGKMDATFERLCHRISRSLAEITAYHHRDDCDLNRNWRGLVHICIPCLSESHLGDSASFARSMREGYLAAENAPEAPNLFANIEHAYADIFHALREMMRLVDACCGQSIGCKQQRLDIAERLMAIDARLFALYAKGIRHRNLLKTRTRTCCCPSATAPKQQLAPLEDVF